MAPRPDGGLALSSSSPLPLSDGSQSSSNRRVRHLASLHLRNFRPDSGTEDHYDAQELFHVSLAIGTAADQVPSYMTRPSQPCVNADWDIDPRDLVADQVIGQQNAAAASSSSSTSAIPSLLGCQNFQISVWAVPESGMHDQKEQQRTNKRKGWAYRWQRDIDLRKLERIPIGLASPAIRRLPANSLLLGLRSSMWHEVGGEKENGVKAPSRSVEQADAQVLGSNSLKGKEKATGTTSASTIITDHRKSSDIITYYLVPPSLVRKSSGSSGRSVSPPNTMATEEDEGGASEPEIGRESEDELAQEDGYDSETAFELSSSAISPRKTGGRPGLERRSSSSRTVRALRKGRRRRTPSISEESAILHNTPNRKPSVKFPVVIDRASGSNKPSEESERRRQIQTWQLEREREKEILERSMRETKMLKSYERSHLEAIVRLQLEVAEAGRALAQERQACGLRLTAPDQRPALTRQASTIRRKVEAVEDILASQNDCVRRLRSTMADKRETFARRRARLELVKRQLQSDVASTDVRREDPDTLRYRQWRQNVLIHNRRTQLLETLSEIYPIRLISASELLLSICQIALPNSPVIALTEGRGKVDEEGVAAALGLAAQLVLLLSSYLDTSLHYEIAPAGSRAMIRDGISLMNGPRGFPLYSKGAEPYRFEYAVFLLNKNIEQLMNAHDLPVLDLRHTLPNLNNLTLTLSSPISLPPSDQSTSPPGQSSVVRTSGISGRAVSAHREYRSIGKGEIILSTKPASTKQSTEDVCNTDSDAIGQGNSDGAAATSNGHGTGMTPSLGDKSDQQANKSAAASWTASLLGWNGSRGAGTASAVD